MRPKSDAPPENSYRWLLSEDATAFNPSAPPGGHAIRDMWNPNCYGHPGKVSDAEYHQRLRAANERTVRWLERCVARSIGQTTAEQAGRFVPAAELARSVDIPFEEFTSFTDAIAFVKANPARYVIKPSGEAQNIKRLPMLVENAIPALLR